MNIEKNITNFNFSNLDVRMIALDLDGTSISPANVFTSRTVESFKLAHKKGANVVIATGRAFHSLPQHIWELEFIDYVITSNGAVTTRLEGEKHEIVDTSYIPEAAVESIVQIMRKSSLVMEIFTQGASYIGRKALEEILEDKHPYRDKEYVRNTRKVTEDIFEFALQNKEHIENISVTFPEAEQKSKVMEMFSEVEAVHLTSSFPYNVEIGNVTATKGEALKHLLAKFHLSADNLMACGDSLNDLEMLKLAKVGVAMGNASEEIKAECKYITASNKEDGVAVAIEQVFKA